MFKWVCAGVVCLSLGIGGVSLYAEQAATTAPAAAASPATAPTTQAAISNTRCPVSGDPVDPKVKTVLYKGKVIGFCCENCVGPFQKNPEKYTKNLK